MAGGSRANTRKKFAKGFRQHGVPGLTRYLTEYKIGDYVNIVVDSSIQKGMPHHFYHGTCGRILDLNRTTVLVLVRKVVGNHYANKKLLLRVEHIRPSNTQKDYHERKALVAAAKARGETIDIRRHPQGPRPHAVVSFADNVPEFVTPIRYEFLA